MRTCVLVLAIDLALFFFNLFFFCPSLNTNNPVLSERSVEDAKESVGTYNNLFEADFSVSLQCSGHNQLEVKLFKIGLGKKHLSYFPRLFFLCVTF